MDGHELLNTLCSVIVYGRNHYHNESLLSQIDYTIRDTNVAKDNALTCLNLMHLYIKSDLELDDTRLICDRFVTKLHVLFTTVCGLLSVQPCPEHQKMIRQIVPDEFRLCIYMAIGMLFDQWDRCPDPQQLVQLRYHYVTLVSVFNTMLHDTTVNGTSQQPKTVTTTVQTFIRKQINRCIEQLRSDAGKMTLPVPFSDRAFVLQYGRRATTAAQACMQKRIGKITAGTLRLIAQYKRRLVILDMLDNDDHFNQWQLEYVRGIVGVVQGTGLITAITHTLQRWSIEALSGDEAPDTASTESQPPPTLVDMLPACTLNSDHAYAVGQLLLTELSTAGCVNGATMLPEFADSVRQWLVQTCIMQIYNKTTVTVDGIDINSASTYLANLGTIFNSGDSTLPFHDLGLQISTIFEAIRTKFINHRELYNYCRHSAGSFSSSRLTLQQFITMNTLYTCNFMVTDDSTVSMNYAKPQIVYPDISEIQTIHANYIKMIQYGAITADTLKHDVHSLQRQMVLFRNFARALQTLMVTSGAHVPYLIPDDPALEQFTGMDIDTLVA